MVGEGVLTMRKTALIPTTGATQRHGCRSATPAVGGIDPEGEGRKRFA